MRTDKERLDDILAYIKKIETGFNLEQYYRDEHYRYAILKYLEIIGEAVRSMTESTKSKIQNIDYKQIISFRNVAVHVYHEIDWDAVLRIVEHHIDPLRIEIEKLYNE